MKKFFLIITLSLSAFALNLFWVDSTPLVHGQQCVGSHTYVNYSCDVSAITRRYTCKTDGADVQSCGAGRCQTFGSVFCQGGASCSISSYGTPCAVYNPPPPPPPRPVPPPPPPTCTDCEEVPPPPPEDTYICNPCSGSCELSSGGSTLQACSSSCQVSLPPEYCNPAPPIISVSSCPELQGNAVEDIVMPGDTVQWTTWAPPPGNSPEERLLNESPGTVVKSYTSPGNMVTIAYMFRVPEGEPHAFYLYDSTIDTFYFYVNQDSYPVIVSETPEIVEIAQNLGYTLINPNEMSEAEAETHPKRVYFLEDDDDGDPWEGDNGHYPIVSHMPFGETLYHIPYVSCASLFRASGHSDYYTTNLQDALADDSLYCFRRQPLTWRFPKDDPDDEFNEQIMTGNYLGMELDWPRHMWLANQGESEGEQVWPRTNLYEGTDKYKYSDELAFSAMGLANGWEGHAGFTPGFVRQAIMQIPVEMFTEGTHNMYAYVHIGDPGDSEPIPNESSDQACEINNPGDPKEIVVDPRLYDDTIEEESPRCEGFMVVEKSTGKIIPAGGKVKIGETYTVRTNAQGDSKIFSFYNSSFNAPQLGPEGTVDNWQKNGDITTFEIVDCDNISGGCHLDNTDDRVLRVARNNNSDQASSNIQTQFIETTENVTDHTFNVNFWARVDGSSRVIPQIILERSKYNSIKIPYDEVGHPTDARELRFANLATSDLNDTTASITVTNQWQPFSGTVTFDYDTDNPTGHPNGNESTSIKLTLKAPSGNANIYYDDITIVGWKQPVPYFRMVPDIAGPTSGYDQCDLSIWQTGSTFTNLSGGHFWSDITIPSTRPGTSDPLPAGTYHMFAALRTSDTPPYTYFANPNSVINCGLNANEWNDDLSSPPLPEHEACLRTVEVVACNETAPLAPRVVEVNTNPNTLPNDPNAAGQTKFNDIRVSGTTLTIKAAPGGSTQAQRDAVTSMTLYITPYNSADAEILIEGIPQNNANNEFVFTHQMTEDFTNEFTISIQAFNENSCNSSGELVSPEFLRHIRIMRQRSGYLIEIPKEEYATYNCRDTRQSLEGKGQLNRVIDITDGSFNTLQLTANTSDSFNPITATYSSTYGEFKRLSFGTVFNNFITDMPYNPLNEAAWRNRITSYTLHLPQNVNEESYICVENCNPNVGDDLNPRCQAGSAVDADMVIPKPQYSPYTHNEYSNDLNIYIGKGNFNDAWWQAKGGLVFSNGNIRSILPLFDGPLSTYPRSLCNNQIATDVCIPFIARTLSEIGNTNSHSSAGFIITNSSTITNGSSRSPNSWRSQNPGTGGEPVSLSSAISPAVISRENYGYYFEQIDSSRVASGLTNSGSNQLNQINSSTLSSAQLYDSTDDLVVYTKTGNLSIDVQNRIIDIPSNRKVIIFVEGNVDIYNSSDSNITENIKVDDGGFLAIIAGGNIMIDHTVGNSDHLQTTAAIEGIFIADGVIDIESRPDGTTDKKFIGEGSFIGLTDVNLNRAYDSDNPFDREKNSEAPVEQFIFSPSLVAATPNFLRQANLTWQETN